MNAEPMDLGPKLRLGKPIGGGASGEVFEAEQVGVGRIVAVKRLRALAGPEARRQFAREARTMALVAHPNIVPVLMHGTLDGRPALVMERVNGVDLAVLLGALRQAQGSSRLETLVDVLGGHCGRWGKGTPWWKVAAEITADVARAVDHAHRAGVIHRDIKPSNVLVATGGDALLTDFGIAIDAAGAERLAGSTSGSLGYTAPELFSTGTPSPASDVYALGQLARELATLKDPGQATGPVGLPLTATRGRRSVRGIPAGLQAILEKATSPEPAARYATSGDLARDLEQLLAGGPIMARAPRALERLKRFVAPYRMGLLAGTVLLAAAVGAPSVVAAQRLKAAKSVHAAAEAADVHLELALEHITGSLLEAASKDFDGKPLLDRKRCMLLGRAVELTESLLPPDGAGYGALERKVLEVHARSLVELAAAEFRIGAFESAFEHLAESTAPTAEVEGDARVRLDERTAFLFVVLAHAVGDWDTVDVRGARALELIQGGRDGAHTARMRSHVWNALIESALARPDAEAAMAIGEAALADARGAALEDPRAGLAFLRVRSNYVAALMEAGELEEAQGINRQARRLLGGMGPSDAVRQVEAIVWNNEGGILRAKGRLAESEAAERKALAAQESLLAASPDSIPAKFCVARSLLRLGMSLMQQGDRSPELKDALRRSAALCDELCAERGARWDAHSLRANLYEKWGALAFEAKDYEGAHKLFEKALVSSERCQEMSPDHPAMEEMRERLWLMRTSMFLPHRPHAEGAVELERYVETFPTDPLVAFNVSLMLTQLSTRLQRSGEKDAASTVEAYRSRATEHLERAVQLGYHDVDRIENQEALSAIREREGFQRALRSLKQR